MKKSILILILILCFCLSGCTIDNLTSRIFNKDSEKETLPVSLDNFYQEASGEYTINYPADWIFEEARGQTIVFSGQKETEGYQTIVKIQKFSKPEDLDMPESIKRLTDNFKILTSSQPDKAKYYDEKIYIYQGENNLELEGKELMIEFANEKGKYFKEWMIIVPDPDGNSLYYFGYNAPIELYDKYFNIAESMLNSWQISE